MRQISTECKIAAMPSVSFLYFTYVDPVDDNPHAVDYCPTVGRGGVQRRIPVVEVVKIDSRNGGRAIW